MDTYGEFGLTFEHGFGYGMDVSIHGIDRQITHDYVFNRRETYIAASEPYV